MRVEITANYVYIYDSGFEISFDVNNVDKVREWIRDDKIKDIINMLKYALERVKEGDRGYYCLEVYPDGYIWHGIEVLKSYEDESMEVNKEVYKNLKKIYEALKAQQ